MGSVHPFRLPSAEHRDVAGCPALNRIDGECGLQPEFEEFAEGPDAFFIKLEDTRIEFCPEADSSVKRMKLFKRGEMEGTLIT